MLLSKPATKGVGLRRCNKRHAYCADRRRLFCGAPVKPDDPLLGAKRQLILVLASNAYFALFPKMHFSATRSNIVYLLVCHELRFTFHQL